MLNKILRILLAALSLTLFWQKTEKCHLILLD